MQNKKLLQILQTIFHLCYSTFKYILANRGWSMFDQNDQSQQTQSPAITPEPVASASAPLVTAEPQTTAPEPAINTTPLTTDTVTPTEPVSTDGFNLSTLETPTTTPAPVTSAPTVDPITPQTISPTPTSPSLDDITASVTPEGDDLLSIKKEALQNLSPLLSQLDQTPEEKFRTTMMLIQASDNQSLIQSAYGAAKEIDDEKVRAQALLDIVNEINYFTQHKPEAVEEKG